MAWIKATLKWGKHYVSFFGYIFMLTLHSAALYIFIFIESNFILATFLNVFNFYVYYTIRVLKSLDFSLQIYCRNDMNVDLFSIVDAILNHCYLTFCCCCCTLFHSIEYVFFLLDRWLCFCSVSFFSSLDIWLFYCFFSSSLRLLYICNDWNEKLNLFFSSISK